MVRPAPGSQCEILSPAQCWSGRCRCCHPVQEGISKCKVSFSLSSQYFPHNNPINNGEQVPAPKPRFSYNPAVEAHPISDVEFKKVQPNNPSLVSAVAVSAAGSVCVAGFGSSGLFEQIRAGLDAAPEADRIANVKKVQGIFQFDIKNAEGKVQSWALDLKNGTGSLVVGASPKPDITIAVSDQDFQDMAAGKLNGQKAFMSGKIKVKGKMMLATKLDVVLKGAQKQTAKL
jgi:putative sterol carrier protein